MEGGQKDVSSQEGTELKKKKRKKERKKTLNVEKAHLNKCIFWVYGLDLHLGSVGKKRKRESQTQKNFQKLFFPS